uniref:Peptidase S1 domain-containing protein n=1 Tax=Cyprinus carpio TaxID=7962 RepID=A0A8C2AKW3_CYPCA
MTIISLLLLASLLPHLTFTGESDCVRILRVFHWYVLNNLTYNTISLSAHVNVGIVNGREAHYRPYMVSIQLNKQHICGGFLISAQWVLTAAHCWNRKYQVLFGICFQFIPHCSKKNIMLINHGCVFELQLYQKIHLNNNVQLIPLPKGGEDGTANRVCSVMGWGRQWTNGSPSARLLEAKVLIENKQKYFMVMYELYDSGGPLVCGATAVGITSFGVLPHCNSHEKPNVYTKISAFLPWIKKNMRYACGNITR